LSSDQSAVETDRDRVAELKARLRNAESLLERALKLDTVVSTAYVARNTCPDALQSLATVNVYQLPDSASGVAVCDTAASTRRPGESRQYVADNRGGQHVAKTSFGESVALLVARRTNNQPTIGRLRVQGPLK